MTPTRRRLIASLTGGFALVGLLTACAVGSGTSGDADQQVSEPQQGYDSSEGGAQDEAAPQEQAGDSDTTAERAVITTTSAYVTVTDVPGAISALRTLVDKYDGYIEARDESLDSSRPSAYVTVRVPAEHNDAFIAELSDFGEVTSLQSSSQDVTMEKVDLESRISALESSITSLEAMLEATDNVTELLEVEEKLSERQAELQSLESQLEVLDDDVAMSTVTVNFSTEYAAPDDDNGGRHDFVSSLGRFFQGLGYAIPGLAIFAIIIAVLWFAVVRRLIRRARRGPGGPRGGRGNYNPQPPTWPAGPGAPQSAAPQQAPQQPAPQHGPQPQPQRDPGRPESASSASEPPANGADRPADATSDAPAEPHDHEATPQQRLADGLPPLPPPGDR
jgi:TolA-binding protein